jgi:hypothetical protein
MLELRVTKLPQKLNEFVLYLLLSFQLHDEITAILRVVKATSSGSSFLLGAIIYSFSLKVGIAL